MYCSPDKTNASRCPLDNRAAVPNSNATTIDSDIPERNVLTTSTAEILTITEQNVTDRMLVVSEVTIFTYIHKHVNTVDTFNRIPEILKWP